MIDFEKLREMTNECYGTVIINESEFMALLDYAAQLEKDAGRYRWLRVQPNDATAPRIDICHWTCEDGDSVNTGEGLRGKDADQAIDTAMEASNAKTKR